MQNPLSSLAAKVTIIAHHAAVAQLVEQRIRNSVRSHFKFIKKCSKFLIFCELRPNHKCSERPQKAPKTPLTGVNDTRKKHCRPSTKMATTDV